MEVGKKGMSPEEEKEVGTPPESAVSLILKGVTPWLVAWATPTASALLALLSAMPGSCHHAVGAPLARGRVQNRFGGGTEPPPRGWSICWKQGGASARDGRSWSGKPSLFFILALMVVFLCTFAFDASGFDSFLYLFHLTELLFYKLCSERLVCFYELASRR